DIGRNSCQAFALRDHGVGFERGDLGAYGTLDNRANLLDNFAKIAAGFRHERRIRGHAVEKTGRGDLANLSNVRRIDKEFHRTIRFTWRSWRETSPGRGIGSIAALETIFGPMQQSATVEVLLPYALGTPYTYVVPQNI